MRCLEVCGLVPAGEEQMLGGGTWGNRRGGLAGV